jgi:hypothetical protein
MLHIPTTSLTYYKDVEACKIGKKKKHSHVQFLKGRFKVVIVYLLVTGLVVGTEVVALVGVAL